MTLAAFGVYAIAIIVVTVLCFLTVLYLVLVAVIAILSIIFGDTSNIGGGRVGGFGRARNQAAIPPVVGAR
jgi:hypothetical protein